MAKATCDASCLAAGCHSLAQQGLHSCASSEIALKTSAYVDAAAAAVVVVVAAAVVVVVAEIEQRQIAVTSTRGQSHIHSA